MASTAYHPQTDGHTEQANQEVEVLIWVLIKEDQYDWAAMLPLVQFALNNHSIQDSDITPFLSQPNTARYGPPDTSRTKRTPNTQS